MTNCLKSLRILKTSGIQQTTYLNLTWWKKLKVNRKQPLKKSCTWRIAFVKSKMSSIHRLGCWHNSSTARIPSHYRRADKWNKVLNPFRLNILHAVSNGVQWASNKTASSIPVLSRLLGRNKTRRVIESKRRLNVLMARKSMKKVQAVSVTKFKSRWLLPRQKRMKKATKKKKLVLPK